MKKVAAAAPAALSYFINTMFKTMLITILAAKSRFILRILPLAVSSVPKMYVPLMATKLRMSQPRVSPQKGVAASYCKFMISTRKKKTEIAKTKAPDHTIWKLISTSACNSFLLFFISAIKRENIGISIPAKRKPIILHASKRRKAAA